MHVHARRHAYEHRQFDRSGPCVFSIQCLYFLYCQASSTVPGHMLKHVRTCSCPRIHARMCAHLYRMGRNLVLMILFTMFALWPLVPMVIIVIIIICNNNNHNHNNNNNNNNHNFTMFALWPLVPMVINAAFPSGPPPVVLVPSYGWQC